MTAISVRPTGRPWRAARVLAALALATAGIAWASPAPARADTTTAVVRSAHFSPDTAGVDVYLQPLSGGRTTLWITGETYGQVSNYQRLAPGVYAVAMRPHGAAASTPAAVSWTLDARAGRAYTAAAIGRNAALQAILLTDDPTAVAPATGRVRFVQAASQASVSVEANGGLALASSLAFGVVTPYRAVPVGTWDLRATATGSATSQATAKVAVPGGSSSTVVVVDTPSGGLGVLSFVDSGAAGTAPVGSIDAGAGGTAPDGSPSVATVTALGSGAGALVVGLLLVVRRFRRLPTSVRAAHG